MSFSQEEKLGVVDLLSNTQSAILFQLAKSVTKNVIDIPTEQDAFDILFLHISDSTTLLNKRLITKDILYKYLHHKRVPITTECTKTQLAKKVIDYWNQNNAKNSSPNVADDANTDLKKEQNEASSNLLVLQDTEFPINLLARKFCEWFFEHYNKNILKLSDFWSDASLVLQISANDGIDEQFCESSISLLQTLVETRERFGFYFNPNLSHAGVQGRMDAHGLVLVLACGSLHTESECVGIFECIFGLVRDPFAENNWKVKKIKLSLRSKGAPAMPSLEESYTLREALELPVTNGELT